MNQFAIMLSGATRPIYIVASINDLQSFWSWFGESRVCSMPASDKKILIQRRYIVAVSGPNSPFDVMANNPFPG